MNVERIPVSSPDLGGNEEQYVRDAVRSTWISSTGPYVDRFEREFAAACGTREAISVSSGTSALHLTMLGHGVGPGDEVVVPSLTYVATANAVVYQGATAVFADVDPRTWCLDPAAVEAAITPRTVGIVAVHLYGHPADMDALQEIADRHGLWIVEDAAEAFGATYKGRSAGSLASVAAFSFYGNKILTSGEGGALTTSDPELAKRMRLFRGQGMDPARRYYFPEVGFNYRLTNVACAMLCAQLERADEMLNHRADVFDRYRHGFAGLPGIGLQPIADWAQPAPWIFCITVDADEFGVGRDALMERLAAEGIETRPFFIPLHTLPPYRSAHDGLHALAETERLGATGINLPTSSSLSVRDVDRVVAAIRSARA